MRKTKSFDAIGDDGGDYTLEEFTRFIAAPTRNNPNREVVGHVEYRTSTGLSVEHLEKGKYRLVTTGVILRSGDLDAP